MQPSRITLLTDFGTRDGYVAAMRGVIASIAPQAVVEDVSHDVPPGDVFFAAWTLSRYWRLFPPDTVHVVIVDPGVGTLRRGLAVEADGRFFVAPDNGVISLALAAATAVRTFEISNDVYFRQPVSPTFHGRDVFAPVAVHLARGVSVDAFGPSVVAPVRIDMPQPRREGGAIRGEVLLADRFGNLITNVPGDWIPPRARIEVAGRSVGELRATYGAAAPGELLAVVGSADVLEISVRDGSAERVLGVGRGAEVRVGIDGLAD